MTTANLVPRERIYSEERDAIILRDYAAGVPRREILAAVCALPGPPPANEKAIKVRAFLLGARRPEGWNGGEHGTWPAARCELVPPLYTNERMPWPEIVNRLNEAFPHLPPVTQKGIENKARKMGLRRPLPPRGEKKRTTPGGLSFLRQVGLDQPMQDNLPPTLEARIEKAAKMLAGKGRDFHVWSVVAHTGLEAWQVCMVAGRIEMGLPLR